MPSIPTPISHRSASAADRPHPRLDGFIGLQTDFLSYYQGFSEESVDITPRDPHNTLSQFHSGKSLPYKGRISREGD